MTWKKGQSGNPKVIDLAAYKIQRDARYFLAVLGPEYAGWQIEMALAVLEHREKSNATMG